MPITDDKLRYTTSSNCYQWPAKEWFKTKSDEELKDLRIKKVEWATRGSGSLFGGG